MPKLKLAAVSSVVTLVWIEAASSIDGIDIYNNDGPLSFHSANDVGIAHNKVLTSFARRMEASMPNSTAEFESGIKNEILSSLCHSHDVDCLNFLENHLASLDSFDYLHHLRQGYIDQHTDFFLHYVEPVLPSDMNEEAKTAIANVFDILTNLSDEQEEEDDGILLPSSDYSMDNEIDHRRVLAKMQEQFEKIFGSVSIEDDWHRNIAMSTISVGMESTKYWVDAFNNGDNTLIQKYEQLHSGREGRKLGKPRNQHSNDYYVNYNHNHNIHTHYNEHTHSRHDDWDDDWKRHDDDDDRNRDDGWRFDDDGKDDDKKKPSPAPVRSPPGATPSPTVLPGNPTKRPTTNPTVPPGTPTTRPTKNPPQVVGQPTPLPTALGPTKPPSQNQLANIITIVAADVIGAVLGAVELGGAVVLSQNITIVTFISAASKAIVGSLLAFVGVILASLLLGD